MGVSERVIRYWKKHPAWQQERQKLINDRAEAMGLKDKQEREEYREKLKKQRQHLEILMEQVYANAMRALNISNQVLARTSTMNDPLKACSIALKSGAHIQSKASIQGITAYIDIMNHLYQVHILIEYFEGLEEGSDR
ncbi:hypothetical protein [Planktothrix mougeotii]|uniref:Transposase n=1 Tax=Planktothrix mougeotii LEGE 06226 TaxID=1828728 RepID=A0ABR9UEL3_9CYAN|nr:hypothetical protein [Planktothrix mougeotii]MBE9144905.1 hypothetical protein [Planktothrix mougeotii LEGE 06226]